MENKDPQIILSTATLAMLEPTFVEVKVDMLRSMCTPCLDSLTSHRDFLSLATWKGQSIAHILASQNRKIAELALKNEEQNRNFALKNEEQNRKIAELALKNEEQNRKIAELALKNEEQNRNFALKNEEQNRKMASLQQQVQFLVESELRRTKNRLFEDGQSLMEEVEATEHHGDSEAVHSPVLRCDEVDLEDVLALMEEYFALPPLADFLVPESSH